MGVTTKPESGDMG